MFQVYLAFAEPHGHNTERGDVEHADAEFKMIDKFKRTSILNCFVLSRQQICLSGTFWTLETCYRLSLLPTVKSGRPERTAEVVLFLRTHPFHSDRSEVSC